MTDSALAPQTPSSRGTGSRVLANSSFVLLSELGSKVASLGLTIVMARVLGPAAYGIYALALSVSAVVFTLAHFGQDQILIREVSRKPARLAKYFANTLVIKLLLGMVALFIGLVGALLMREDGLARFVIFIIGLAGLADVLTTTCFGAFQALDHMGYIPLVRITQRVFLATCGSALLLLGFPLEAVAGSYLVAAVVAMLLSAGLLMRIAHPTLQVRPKEWAGLLRAAVPIGVAGVLGSVLFRIDTVILSVLDTDSAVGLYNAAYRFVDMTLFLSFGIGTAVYPILTRIGARDSARLARLFGAILKLLLALALPVAALAVALADQVISLVYGPGFDRAGLALVLLAPTIALFPIAHVSGLLLISQGQERRLVRVYALVAFTNVLLNILLIPRFSLYGAAIVTSVTEAALVLHLAWMAHRFVGLFPWVRAISGPAVSALACTGVALAMGAGILLVLLVSGALFVVILVVFERVVFPADLMELRRAVAGLRTSRAEPLAPNA